MVMDGDPRENIDILLDTKSHTLFAIRGGEVLRNRLLAVRDEGEERKSAGWTAYSPPPGGAPELL